MHSQERGLNNINKDINSQVKIIYKQNTNKKLKGLKTTQSNNVSYEDKKIIAFINIKIFIINRVEKNLLSVVSIHS